MRLESTSSICSCVLSSYLVSVLVLVVSRLHCIYCVNPYSILYGNLSSYLSKLKKQTSTKTSENKKNPQPPPNVTRNGYNVRFFVAFYCFFLPVAVTKCNPMGKIKPRYSDIPLQIFLLIIQVMLFSMSSSSKIIFKV